MTPAHEPAHAAQIQVAHENRDALRAMIDTLVGERLVACGQVVGPIESTYRWEGAVRHEREWLALLKTGAVGVDRLVARIAELHAYDVPEIIVTEIVAGHEPYLRWVAEQTRTG
jgi:periplasmic divalent cation tolerance protein